VVLVVDGNQDVREMYCTYFTYVGYECIGAATGDEALRSLHERVPDLVLLEESLPGMDGWQLLKMIRTDAKLRSVRVVVLTADVFEAPRQRAADMGADGFAAKPVLMDDLAALVRRLLKPTA
jgi:DNA-binding response OmpR family regulator